MYASNSYPSLTKPSVSPPSPTFLYGSLGHTCPSTFNPADYYIHTLAVLPGHEHRSRDRIKRICDNFAVSAYCKDLDITIQYHENLALSHSDSGDSVSFCFILDCVFVFVIW